MRERIVTHGGRNMYLDGLDSLDQKISGTVSCYFEIETAPRDLAEVTEILHQNNPVTQIYRVTGKDKLHVHAVAASSEEMETFLRTVIDTLPGVVSCSGYIGNIRCGGNKPALQFKRMTAWDIRQFAGFPFFRRIL